MLQTQGKRLPALGDRRPTPDEGKSHCLDRPHPHISPPDLPKPVVSSIAIPGRILTAVLFASLVVTAAAQIPAASQVRLNQIQVIGTHNSYHAGIAPHAAKVWQAKYPEQYQKLDYQHASLPQPTGGWNPADRTRYFRRFPRRAHMLIPLDLRW